MATADILTALVEHALADVQASRDRGALEEVRVRLLGKKGLLTEQLKGLGKLPAAERPAAGQSDQRCQGRRFKRLWRLAVRASRRRRCAPSLRAGAIDVTLPGRGQEPGSLHPVTRTRLRIERIFMQAGFQVATGPEVEDDFHNFEALNIPRESSGACHARHVLFSGRPAAAHPHLAGADPRHARAATADVADRAGPGLSQRLGHDAHARCSIRSKASRSGESVSFANLKAMLHTFVEHFFEHPLGMRLRPSYFPFTEPSAEVDIECVFCHGAGCRVCKHTGWLEILGCGMIHPNVLAAAGIDAEQLAGVCVRHGDRAPRHAALRRR